MDSESNRDQIIMTDIKKVIWVAVFSAEWVRQYGELRNTGAPMDYATMADNACTAVHDIAELDRVISEHFGEDSVQYRMYRETIYGD